MNTPKESYSYSLDGEYYSGSFDSREDAAAEAFASHDDRSAIWTGRCVTPYRLADADYLIEQIACNTTEEAGDWADDYLGFVTKEAKEELQVELQALWDRWERKHELAPTWFNIEDAHKHTREDQP